jgi:hypothetical protein
MRAYPLKVSRKLLRSFGYELVKAPRCVSTSLAGRDAIYGYGGHHELFFDVPLRKCVTYLCFSYDPGGWHPLTATVRQFMQDNSTIYRTSILRKFYAAFRPETQCQAHFDADLDHLQPLTRVSSRVVLEPWVSQRRLFNNNGKGNQNFGPVAEVFGEAELQRLRRLYASLNKYGYRPERFGHIAGFFLRGEDDYRFFVTAGIHRAAVLTAMGASTVAVQFHPRTARSVDLRDMENWPQVSRGEISAEVAEAVFMRFLEENGRGRARALGILDDDYGEPRRTDLVSLGSGGVARD